jgi:signal transduction histidine kinase
MVDADADRLRQVLSNYLANAVRYSPEEQPIEVRLRLAAVGDVADESEEGVSAAQAPQAADEGQMTGATSAQGVVSLAGATDSNSLRNGRQRDARMATRMARGKSRREVAWVEVRDHGRGISPGEQETIWSRFQRARTVREAKGLGLGLYIARMLVELHEGQVGLESDVGRGSTFWFTVPLVSGALAAESTPTPESMDSTE